MHEISDNLSERRHYSSYDILNTEFYIRVACKKVTIHTCYSNNKLYSPPHDVARRARMPELFAKGGPAQLFIDQCAFVGGTGRPLACAAS